MTQRTSSFLGFSKLLKIEPTNVHVIRMLENTRLRRLQLSVNLNIAYKNERIDGYYNNVIEKAIFLNRLLTNRKPTLTLVLQ